MYTETMAWRGSSGLAKKMNDHGTIPDLYGADGMQKTDLSSWAWKRATSTPDAALVQRFGFFGRLGRLGPDDEAIIIWRLGAADLKTTGHHEDKILEAFNAHMEEYVPPVPTFRQQRSLSPCARTQLHAGWAGGVA
jgi:hypothetical protein